MTLLLLNLRWVVIHILLVWSKSTTVLTATHGASNTTDAGLDLVLESCAFLTTLLRQHLVAHHLLVLRAA